MAWRAPGQACCVSLSLSEAPGIKTKRECVRVCMRINTRGSPSHTHLTRMSHRRSILPYCHSGTHRSAVCVCVCGQRIQVCVCVCVYEREREWQNVCNPLDTAAEEQVYWWKHWSQQKAGPPIAPAQLSVSAFQLPSLTLPLPLSRSLFRTHSRSGGVLSRHPTPPPRHYDNWVLWASWIVGGESEQEAKVACAQFWRLLTDFVSIPISHLHTYSDSLNRREKRHSPQYGLLFWPTGITGVLQPVSGFSCSLCGCIIAAYIPRVCARHWSVPCSVLLAPYYPFYRQLHPHVFLLGQRVRHQVRTLCLAPTSPHTVLAQRKGHRKVALWVLMAHKCKKEASLVQGELRTAAMCL